MESLAPVTEFKTVARRDFSTLAKAQIIGQILHAQGFGVRINHHLSITTDAFGNTVKSGPSTSTRVRLSTNANWDALGAAEREFRDASDAVSVEAVKAKLAL